MKQKNNDVEHQQEVTSKKKQRKSKNGFTQVPNEILYNEKLTLAEKGMMAEFISNPPEWVTYQKELFRRSLDKFPQQRKVLRQLENKQLILLKRTRNSNGHFQYEYYLSTDPLKKAKVKLKVEVQPIVETRGTEDHVLVEPLTDEPSLENCSISNTEYLSNTDQSNIEPEVILSKSKEQESNKFLAPSSAEVISFFESLGSNASAGLGFYNEFKKRNWKDLQGNQLSNWRGMARKNIERGTYSSFEICDEEREEITALGKEVYLGVIGLIQEMAKTNPDAIRQANFTQSHIVDALFEYCVQHKISTRKELFSALRIKPIEPGSIHQIRKSLGLNSSSNDKGIEY
ncbi:MAG: hypothetical protein KA163_04990 [Bacteroidia bacterium]|nr:hypothetical protein [Bacteroidia bacterium]